MTTIPLRPASFNDILGEPAAAVSPRACERVAVFLAAGAAGLAADGLSALFNAGPAAGLLISGALDAFFEPWPLTPLTAVLF